jgi:hypothetical protein
MRLAHAGTQGSVRGVNVKAARRVSPYPTSTAKRVRFIKHAEAHRLHTWTLKKLSSFRQHLRRLDGRRREGKRRRRPSTGLAGRGRAGWLQTKQVREFKTDSSGNFLFPEIVAGEYDIHITNPGFKAYEQKAIGVEVQEHVDLQALKMKESQCPKRERVIRPA